MHNYVLVKKLTKIIACILIDVGIFLIWRFSIAGSDYTSESARKLSIVIMCLCMLIPVWKLRVWTVFTEMITEGRIKTIQKRTTDNFSFTGVHPRQSYLVGLSSTKEEGYKYSYYIVFTDKKDREHDITLEYTDNAHIFPYNVGEEIIKFPYAPFPQIKEKDRIVCVFCGMPVIRKDLEDKKCHFCGKPIKK